MISLRFFALLVLATCVAAAARYDTIGPANAALSGLTNFFSQAFEATQTSEFGDFVQLDPGAAVSTFETFIITWACENLVVDPSYANGLKCVSAPGSTYASDITLKLYNVGGTPAAPTIGALFHTVTQTFQIPYRPTSAPAAACPSSSHPYGNWIELAPPNNCRTGIAHLISFPLAASVLPASATNVQLFWTISYDTTNYGANPKGPQPCSTYVPMGPPTTPPTVNNCPYDSQNVGYLAPPIADNAAPLTGDRPYRDGYVVNSRWSNMYCPNPALAVNSLAFTSGSALVVPNACLCDATRCYIPMATFASAFMGTE